MFNWKTALGATIASALIYYFGTGLEPIWPLVWVAPLPILFIASRYNWWVIAVCAFVGFALGRMNLWGYALALSNGDVPGAVSASILFMLVPAIAFTLVVLLSRYAASRLPPGWAVFVFPVALTSYEFIASSNRFTGTLLSLAYSQADFTAILQITSLFGIAGVTFLVSLVPSMLAIAWSHRRPIVSAPSVILVAMA